MVNQGDARRPLLLWRSSILPCSAAASRLPFASSSHCGLSGSALSFLASMNRNHSLRRWSTRGTGGSSTAQHRCRLAPYSMSNLCHRQVLTCAQAMAVRRRAGWSRTTAHHGLKTHVPVVCPLARPRMAPRGVGCHGMHACAPAPSPPPPARSRGSLRGLEGQKMPRAGSRSLACRTSTRLGPPTTPTPTVCCAAALASGHGLNGGGCAGPGAGACMQEAGINACVLEAMHGTGPARGRRIGLTCSVLASFSNARRLVTSRAPGMREVRFACWVSSAKTLSCSSREHTTSHQQKYSKSPAHARGRAEREDVRVRASTGHGHGQARGRGSVGGVVSGTSVLPCATCAGKPQSAVPPSEQTKARSSLQGRTRRHFQQQQQQQQQRGRQRTARLPVEVLRRRGRHGRGTRGDRQGAS